MSLCDDFNNWDDLPLDLREKALEEAINWYLNESGYNSIQVSSAELPAHGAKTNRETGDITYDRETLQEKDRDVLWHAAFHEAWHSMGVQDGDLDRQSEDEQIMYNDIIWMDEYADDRYYYVPDHELAEVFAEFMLDWIKEKCTTTPKAPKPAAESAPHAVPVEADWAFV